MANTTNFGWETPDDTDLVKDGASAMRTLGNSIDASFVDLKGGTTGQVLAKASNTDLDFTWSSVDPLTILDAKGDLISATAADTPARLAVGTNGQFLSANSSTSTGLEWVTLSTGGMTSLASGTLSGSTVDIQNIPTTYNDLVLYIRNPYVSSGASLGYIQIRVNGQTSSYYAWNGQASSTNFNNNGTTAWNLWDGTNNYISNSTTDRAGIYFRLFDYASTTSQKTTQFNIAASNTINNTNGNGVLNQSYSTTAITSLQILTSFSTFSGGTYALYGVK